VRRHPIGTAENEVRATRPSANSVHVHPVRTTAKEHSNPPRNTRSISVGLAGSAQFTGGRQRESNVHYEEFSRTPSRMPVKRNKPEQIVTLVWLIEVKIANGKTTNLSRRAHSQGIY
jgi:hypothetical protein